MPIPASGPISSTDLQTEFGGQNPISLNEYYAGGIYVGAGTTGTNGPVPSSGPISLRDFYGTSRLTTTVNYIAPDIFSRTYITSADGITWTARQFPLGSGFLWVGRSSDKWVVFPTSGNIALYSSDGINWTSTTLPSSAQFASIGYTGTRLVSGGFQNTTTAIWSDNGITWNTSTLPSADYWMRTSGGNGIAILSSGYSNAVARTTDGVSWTRSTIPGPVIVWSFAAYGGGNWVLVSYSNADAGLSPTNLTARSTDNANTWVSGGTLPSTGQWYSVAYAQSNFVTVKLRQNPATTSPTNNAAYSSDGGVTWNAVTLPSTQEWVGTSYAQPFSNVVTLGLYTNVGAYSSDGGVTWTQTTLPVAGVWAGIAAK